VNYVFYCRGRLSFCLNKCVSHIVHICIWTIYHVSCQASVRRVTLWQLNAHRSVGQIVRTTKHPPFRLWTPSGQRWATYIYPGVIFRPGNDKLHPAINFVFVETRALSLEYIAVPDLLSITRVTSRNIYVGRKQTVYNVCT